MFLLFFVQNFFEDLLAIKIFETAKWVFMKNNLLSFNQFVWQHF